MTHPSEENLHEALGEPVEAVPEEERKQGSNHLSINNLPTEILRIIFHDAIARDCGREVITSQLAAVCGHWRAVALEDPSLWSTINFTRSTPAQVKGHLERSGKLPLTLLYGHMLQRQREFREVLSSVLSKIRILEVVVQEDFLLTEQGDLIRFLFSLPTSTLPGLERLTLDLENMEIGTSVLTSPAFGGQTPSLRYLKLAAIRMPWNRGFYRDLHTLEIRGCSWGFEAEHDEDICHLFRDCPRLHEFDLCLARPPPTLDENNQRLTASHPPVPVPHLRRLRLNVPLDYTHHILSSIVVDALYELRLTCHSNKWDIHEARREARVALSLPRLLPPSALSQVDTIHSRWSSDVRKQKGYIQGFDSGSQSLKADTPEFFLGWSIVDDRIAPDIQGDLFLSLARATSQRMKPIVSQKLTYVTFYPIPTAVRVPMLLSASMHSHPLLKTEGCSHHGATLRQLELEDTELDLDEMLEVMQWCRNHSSLLELSLSRVKIRAPTEADAQQFEKKLREAEYGWEVKRTACGFILPNSRVLYKLW